MGHIAKCLALVGMGETDKGCGTCDMASLHFPSYHFSLFLIKVRDSAQPLSPSNFFCPQAVVLFIAGKHVDAMSRMDDLITDGTGLWTDPSLYVVQVRGICPCVR